MNFDGAISDFQVMLDDFYKNKNYEVQPNQSIVPKNDKSILFVNSSMVPYKSQLNNGEMIQDSYSIQDCLRTNVDITNENFLIYFKMLGNIGMKQSAQKFLTDFLQFLTDLLELPFSDIYIITPEEKFLKELSLETIGNKNTVIIPKEEYPEHMSVEWQYGKDYDFSGIGLTIAFKNSRVPSCTSSCTVLCDKCNTTVQLGNLILIENHKHKTEYIELGIGVERLLSTRYQNNIYEIEGVKKCVNDMAQISKNSKNAKKILALQSGILRIILEGVKPGGKKRRYVLKKLIRQYVYVLVNSVDQSKQKDKYLIQHHDELVDCYSAYNTKIDNNIIEKFHQYTKSVIETNNYKLGGLK